MALLFETIQPRVQEGMSFYLRVVGGGWHFRIVPIRSPDQPRLWRILVEACESASLIQPLSGYAPFLTHGVFERGDLTGRLDAIKTTPMEWVGLMENRDLLAWLEDVVATPVSEKPAPAIGRPTRKQSPA